MFSKRTPLLLGLLAIVLLASVFYTFYRSRHPRFDWSDQWNKKAYQETNNEPYGTQVAHRLLETYFPGKQLKDLKKSVAKELPGDSTFHGAYVFVGEGMYLDSLSTAALLQFVHSGNTALISSKTIPFDLMFKLYFEECEEAVWGDYASFRDTFVRASLGEPTLSNPASLHFSKQNRPFDYSWHYIESQFFCDAQPQRALGYLNDSLVNFAEFPFGSGRFLLHTNPLVFSNYSLLRPETRPYVSGVLSWLPEGDIYWDAVSRIPEQVGRRRNQSDRNLPEEHLLTYILQQPPLAWAWYLLFILAGLWLVFRAKRRQRVIPVLPKNENSSYAFISTIAHLHFRERNYRGVSKENMKLFLAQIRERYNLFATLDPQTELPRTDVNFFGQLAQVSEVPEVQIRALFAQYTQLIQMPATETGMIDLHLAMEGFLKKAR